MINNADYQYNSLLKEILETGYKDQNRTGISTYKLFGKTFRFDLQKEFPIITTKFVAFKTAIKEIMWIYVQGNNNVKDLQNMNVKIWDEWMKEDGTIGPAYGYQARHWGGNIDQVKNLIDTLKNDPYSRRMIVSFWNVQDLPEMALQPCCFLTMWDVVGDMLNMSLIIRSNDLILGNPFNMCQYAALQCMVAHVTGFKPGIFSMYMNNVHVYENHIEGAKLQLSREPYESTAKIWINPEVKNFDDFKPNDIRLLDYKCHDKIKFDVAV